MSDWFISTGQISSVTSGTINNSRLGTVTTAAANTKGAYQQLLSTTPFDSDFVLLLAGKMIAPPDYYSIDFAVGAIGQEVNIINDLMFGLTNDGLSLENAFYAFFPLRIPTGQRLSARIQGTVSGRNIHCGMVLFRSNNVHYLPTFNKCTTYGAQINGQTTGITINPGSIANQKGAWSQITASTTSPTRAIGAMVFQGANGRINSYWRIDIGIGASGQEKVIIGDIPLIEISIGGTINPPFNGPFFVNIPQGSRISMRAQSNYTGIENQFYAVLYCLS